MYLMRWRLWIPSGCPMELSVCHKHKLTDDMMVMVGKICATDLVWGVSMT